jgi:hypothetical protein
MNGVLNLVLSYTVLDQQQLSNLLWSPWKVIQEGPPVANERTTEDLVREYLKTHPALGQKIEEQTSSNPQVKKALSAASKQGDGVGKPEFIITIPDNPRLVIVVECKADYARHESPNRGRPNEFAVDGAIHYSKHLSKYFDVIAIAVSGTEPTYLRISTFRQLKGTVEVEPLSGPHGLISKLIPVTEYRRLLTFDSGVRQRSHAELMAFSRILHNYMRDYAKLSEQEKPLVVSGILLALRDDVFKRTWDQYKPNDLARELYHAIQRQAEAATFAQPKLRVMLQPYSFIETHPELSKADRNSIETPLRRLVADIDEHVRPYLDDYDDIDVIGQFYGEFLRYTGGDKKGLGIVLTPRHLTELFAKIAGLGPNSIVLDTCCGTGGFLISAMTEMDAKAGYDQAVMTSIRQHQLLGVEQQPYMFALAVSNMILRGDGKANLYQGSCFEPQTTKALVEGIKDKDGQWQHRRHNVGLINPPFSQRGNGLRELDFVNHLLDCLAPDGTAVVVVPMSCAIEPHPSRQRLLSKHTLLAVMSLPNDLFHPVGVITCAMVLRAHQPHAAAPAPTWFGYWKDDGYIKTKNRGRIDLDGRWPAIRDKWVESYHSRTVEAGFSVTKKVTAIDEWCAEAYMETDYSSLSKKQFEETLKKYAIFSMLYADQDGADPGLISDSCDAGTCEDSE